MSEQRPEVTPETDCNSPPAVAPCVPLPRRRSRRGTIAAFCVVLGLGAFSTVAFDYATAPLSKAGFCVSCHEMDDPHARWQVSRHHVNPSGVQVTCVDCHLPPKDDWVAHTAAKAWLGGKHAAVHLFGEYDGEAARRTVHQTMSNDRCVKCHSNLIGCPSSQAVGTVHTTSLQRANDRPHACVACHDKLHAPCPAPLAKKNYERGDNSFCLVCHINFQQEAFTVVHVKAGISCPDCHGASNPHAADEEHLTPADTMYSKGKVNASCMTAQCHPRGKMEAEIGHRPYFAGADPDHSYCTDCHGQHRIPTRMRRWDKDTRQLIEVDGRPVSRDQSPPHQRPAESGDSMM